MAYSPEKVISVATAEVGYLEKKSNKDLNSKTANAGSKNYTKYGEWFGVNPALWCALFVCWCFAMAYGSIAKEMLCGGYSAACETMRQRFIKEGRYDKNPKVGDCIFFSGTRHAGANHIGIVWKVDGSRIYTIEGNTSGANGVVDNGGGVAQKSYSRSYSRIMGYGHPDYDIGGDEVVKPSISETAKAVVNGKYGNGQDRIDKLKALGYSDAEIKEIQAKVNEMVKPVSKPSTKPTQSASKPKETPASHFEVGSTYTTQVSDLNVRTGAGTGYRRKSRSELTADGRKHADSEGQLKSGTRVTCKAVKTVGNQVWIQTPSGWLCAYNGSKYYVK